MPRTHLTPGGCATHEFGPAAAIGAKVGAPTKAVVALVQDRALDFQSTSAALRATVESGLGVTWVILRGAAGYARDTPSFAETGETYGVPCRRITDPMELASAFREAIGCDEPRVVEVAYDHGIRFPTPAVAE